MTDHNLYFVYLGNNLPQYADAAIQLANVYSGLTINFIGSTELKNKSDYKNVSFIDVSDFYNESKFIEISKNLTNDHLFREGFWLKSLERFFVLEQFMRSRGINQLFHAELDQLLFGVNSLIDKLASIEKDGFYVPFHKPGFAVASLVYVKNPNTLTSLIKFAETSHFNNEMQLISDWGESHPDLIYALPTLASEVLNYKNLNNVPVIGTRDAGGIIDAAQIGQGIAGIDPKNVPIRKWPANKFVDAPEPFILSKDILKEINFVFVPEENTLLVNYKGTVPYRLFNLHIHSKVHRNLLELNPSLVGLFDSVNKGKVIKFKRTRRIQVRNYLKIRLGNLLRNPNIFRSRVNARLNFAFGIRKSSEPFISGDSFRKMADLVWEKSSSKFEINEVKKNSIIFCESDSISDLNSKILTKLSFPVTLILGNSDQNHDKNHYYLKDNRNIRIIFAQNLAIRMDGFHPLPIGLENAWHSKHGKVLPFKILRKVKRQRKPRIMWTFSIQTNPQVRSKAAFELSKIEVADRYGSISPEKHRQLLLTYSFIASPPGNGLDTHRTWEAMYLGCVPIVLRSYMSEFFENLDLPIWVVDSYDEIVSLSEKQLEEIYREFKTKFDNEALWFEYWAKQIKRWN